ncbi:MAG: 30S ribosomal protein S16 [Phycisphaerales bacterium]
MVRIRLKRMGRRHRPFYRINAIEKRNQRDGRVIENLGWYDPMAKDADKQLKIEAERIKFWISRGAQCSDTMNDILAREGVIDAAAWKAERDGRLVKRKVEIAAQQEAAAAAKKAEEEAAKKAEEEAAKKKAEEEAAAAAAAAEAPAEEEAKSDEG